MVDGDAPGHDRGTPEIDGPDRLDTVEGTVDGMLDDAVTALGVDETAYLRASATHSTTFATGVADLTPGRLARLLDMVEGRSGTVLAAWLCGGCARRTRRGGHGSRPRRWIR